jgi:hypothetical protein
MIRENTWAHLAAASIATIRNYRVCITKVTVLLVILLYLGMTFNLTMKRQVLRIVYRAMMISSRVGIILGSVLAVMIHYPGKT